MSSANRPACARHPGSRVVRDGTYATAAGERQRYRCVPADGERAHRFVVDDGVPHGFAYSTDDIATALAAVGRGESYRRAAQLVAARTARGATVDGNTVADWVEVFAPALHERHGQSRWPAVVELDSITFRARPRGDEGPEGGTAFRLLAALAPRRRGRSQLVALEPVPGDGSQAAWEELLRSKTGTPLHVVCAPDRALERAIAAVWPPSRPRPPRVFLCHRHLERELLELLQAAGVEPSDRFYRAAAQALGGVARWRRFLAAEPPRRVRALDPWLAKNGARISAQLALGDDTPLTTALLEERLDVVRERLADRRGNLRNRERTRRLLMLLQLDLNGHGDAASYVRVIADELRRTDGRAAPRRTILDGGAPSLGA
jgi:hypothetical protein